MARRTFIHNNYSNNVTRAVHAATATAGSCAVSREIRPVVICLQRTTKFFHMQLHINENYKWIETTIKVNAGTATRCHLCDMHVLYLPVTCIVLSVGWI